MDRAYPSFESMFEMEKKNIHFIFRCKTGFSNQIQVFYQSDKTDEIIRLKPRLKKPFSNKEIKASTVIRVRALKVVLSSGEVEILLTSLLDKETYPLDEFKDLYFQRWNIETFYNRFKNIIGVEHFSLTSEQFIQQEFNCALYMSTMQSILTKEAQQEADVKYEGRKYTYKINSSLSLSFIRNKLLDLFSTQTNNELIMEELKQLFIKNVVPVRPGRTYERNAEKYRNRSKPKQFQNRRTIL